MKQSSQQRVSVRDVMETRFDMIDGIATVAEALKNAKHLATRCLIVDKRDEYDEYGIVLLSDIAKKVLAKDRAPERVNVYEIMNKPVISVAPDMDIRYCSRLFQNFGVSRAPVIENGQVVGVVGYTDMVLHGVLDKL